MNYKTPGVKVEEIATLPPSVAPVDTAVPAFIGYTEKNALAVEKITSFLDFVDTFGGPDGDVVINTINGTGTADVSAVNVVLNGGANTFASLSGQSLTGAATVNANTFSGSKYFLYYSIKLFFENGGGKCYVASAGLYDEAGDEAVQPAKLTEALDRISRVDEPTMLVVPDAIGCADATAFNTVMNHALRQCDSLKDRFTILDTFPNADPDTEISTFRSGIVDALDYGAAYFPRLKLNDKISATVGGAPTLNLTVSSITALKSNISITAGGDDILNPGNPVTPGTLQALETAGSISVSDANAIVSAVIADATVVSAAQTAVNTNAQSQIPSLSLTTDASIEIGPSGVMAGIYARTDTDRGVWKAPANTAINGAAPILKIDNDFQDGLNVDVSTGKAVNAIRTFVGKGDLVWGARTLKANDLEWRYINVRRLFIFVEESVKKAADQFVFEPNSGQTWSRLKGMIENFLTDLWRQGALAGAKPADAFQVKIGLGQTMSTSDVLEGRMNVEIAMAPSRPAEFIILKFSHKLQEA